MPAAAPPPTGASRDHLTRLGERLRMARKAQKVSAVAAAEAAGLSRVTVHRIERGEPSVAMGAWMALAAALGQVFELSDGMTPASAPPLPPHVALNDYPQLRKLAWQLAGVDHVSPQEALDLYERNWRHVDRAALGASERALIEALSAHLGGGRLLA